MINLTQKNRSLEWYVDWIAQYDFEVFATLRLNDSIPLSNAAKIFRNEVLLPICRSSPHNDIGAIIITSPGHPGLQRRHAHAAVATRNRDVSERIDELIKTLAHPENIAVRGSKALDIRPYRRFDDVDAEGKARPGHPRYMAGHLTGPEDLSVYGKEFLKTINRSLTHGN